LKIHKQLAATGTICPFVFHRRGERIVHFRAAWKNACKAAGCPGTLVHDMRRSALRTFERAGVPRSVAMSLVGHKTGVDLSPVRDRGRSHATRSGTPRCLDGCRSGSTIDSHRHCSPSRQSTPGPRHGVSPAIRHLLGGD
jgi:hypothetical protein